MPVSLEQEVKEIIVSFGYTFIDYLNRKATFYCHVCDKKVTLGSGTIRGSNNGKPKAWEGHEPSHHRIIEKGKSFGYTNIKVSRGVTTYTCKCGKENERINNDQIIRSNGPRKCINCGTKNEKSEKDRIREMIELAGGEMTSYEYKEDGLSRIVKYICQCGDERQNYASNFLRKDNPWKGTCNTCSNAKRGNINSIDTVKGIFESKGLVLLSDTYSNNKEKLEFKCPYCNKIAHMSLNEVRRDRLCENCAVERRKNTCIQKYGVDNPSKCSEIVEKIKEKSYSTKDYLMPSGNIIKIQGYENLALDILLKDYNEGELVTNYSEMPTITYNDNKRYFPDIYIPMEKTFIEVKSTFTYNSNDKAKKVFDKIKAVINQGYVIRLMIFTDRGKERLISDYIFDMPFGDNMIEFTDFKTLEDRLIEFSVDDLHLQFPISIH
jgi:hypothetical protein